MRSRLMTVGDTIPRSRRALEGWLVPARRASSTWLSPARRRAARTALPTMIDALARS
jgi:hypothetical protein